MGQKRKKDQTEFDGIHASRKHHIHGSKPQSSKKPRRSSPQDVLNQSHSINAIKKRIRDTNRRLEKVQHLPATVRLEDERALAAYEAELATALEAKQRKKMIERYHMVRFFERQKATRIVKKLQKRILSAKSTEEVDKLKPLLHIAEVDLNYTQFSPLSEIYVSLYPKDHRDGAVGSVDGESAEAIRLAKPAMWHEVEKCSEAGTLQQLRNRKATVNMAPVNKRKDPRATNGATVKVQPRRTKEPDSRMSVERTESEDDGDISDGGFFEE